MRTDYEKSDEAENSKLKTLKGRGSIRKVATVLHVNELIHTAKKPFIGAKNIINTNLHLDEPDDDRQ